jgi:nitrilase
VNPLGEIIAGPVYDAEAVITADIDLDDIVRGKFDLDTTGHYSRPDVFELVVNTRPSVGVRVSELEESGLAEDRKHM